VRLTGLPVILLIGVLVVAAVAATVCGWRLSGRKRMALRMAGLLAVELLIVADIGLIANRQDGFYPSWRALGGADDVVVVPSAKAGRLDGRLNTDGTSTWSPPEVAAWHLAAAPLVVPSLEYAKHPNHTFPVVIALTTPAGVAETRSVAAAATGVLTVVLEPTRRTTASSLDTLRDLLGRDVRIADGLVVLTDPGWAPLAAAWPGRPAVIAGHTAAAFTTAEDHLSAPLAAAQELPS
jgi:hypothetical protein